MSGKKQYRLLTRSDFDGLVCAILLKEMGILGDILFVHPKDVQDGAVEVLDSDILTNLPYAEGCYLCFDHHSSEQLRRGDEIRPNHVLHASADSAARVVYEHFGGKARFTGISDKMMEAVDKSDSAKFTMEDVLDPEGWELLSFLMDARTGLGRFHDFRISNYQLMMDLIDYCKEHSIEEILSLPDVAERVELLRSHQSVAKDQMKRCSSIHGDLVVLDLTKEETIYAANRFVIYSVFPECNISMHCLPGRQQQNVVFTIGKSIFNRTSEVNIGELCLQYGGGGHAAAGTCQVSHDRADRVRKELISRIHEINEGVSAGI